MSRTIYRVKKEMTFDAAHRLKDYEGLCSNIHGHTYKVEVTLAGDNLRDGMLVDFKLLKGAAGVIVGGWDHALILEKGDPILEAMMEPSLPRIKLVVFDVPPTAENMAKELKSKLRLWALDKHVDVEAVTIWETPTSSATV